MKRSYSKPVTRTLEETEKITQQEKKLLLEYLCMAMPYGVVVKHFDTKIGSEGNLVGICILDDITTTIINEDGYEDIAFLIESKPYLRSLNDMTEEEELEYRNICINPINRSWNEVNWLLKKHFNIFLPENLYIKVSKENNPYK